MSIEESKHELKFPPSKKQSPLLSGPSRLQRSCILGEQWNRLTYRLALQRLEQLNDHALRDIGVWREPESRVDEWWKMNPPP
jgi:uncharacterized protein YjiS (DUF1127 family)